MTENPYRIHIRHGDFELDVEGDRAFVESYIEAFLSEGAIPEGEEDFEPVEEIGAKAPKVVKTKARGRAQEKAKGGRRKALPEVEASKLKSFMNGKALKGNKERYLEYIRFWKAAGVHEVSDVHMRACYLAEGLDIPPTGRQHFTTLRKEGVLKPGSARGFWALVPEAKKAPEKPAKAPKKAAAKEEKAKKEKAPAPRKTEAKKPKAKKEKAAAVKEAKPPAKKLRAAGKKAKGAKAPKAPKKPAKPPAPVSEAAPTGPAPEVPAEE